MDFSDKQVKTILGDGKAIIVFVIMYSIVENVCVSVWLKINEQYYISETCIFVSNDDCVWVQLSSSEWVSGSLCISCDVIPVTSATDIQLLGTLSEWRCVNC